MKLHCKVLIASCLIIINSISEIKAQNLLNLDGWNVGTGSAGIFLANSMDSENFREWGEGPNGKNAILWKAVPSGDGNADGGWNTSIISILHTNMYRLSVWIKKSNSKDGTTYFGTQNVLNLNGSANSNPYFWSGKLPVIEKWYLLVAYVHASNDASMVNFGGIYDGATGTKVLDMTDFKFSVGATQFNHRAYLYYDPNVNDRQYFYAPRIDLVNGNEPTIAALMGLQGIAGSPAYFPDKVGIKTNNPGDYDLAVNGKVRAREIKVENNNWPDYVFSKEYELTSLKKTEEHIKEKGHLPGIPSALEVNNNGVNLGEMNAKLLEKIEELTLHLIHLDTKVNLLQEENQKLKRTKNKKTNEK